MDHEASQQAKSVRFAPTPADIFSYPRVGADDIGNVYYQEDDYRRFRLESWLESLRVQRHCLAAMLGREEAIKHSSSRSTTDRNKAIRNFGNNSRGTFQQQGAAQAA